MDASTLVPVPTALRAYLTGRLWAQVAIRGLQQQRYSREFATRATCGINAAQGRVSCQAVLKKKVLVFMLTKLQRILSNCKEGS